MTYFDLNIYNPEKLEGDEALVMEGYNIAVEEVEGFFGCIAPPSGIDALDAIYEGVARHIRDTVLSWLEASRIELTCSPMEGSEKYAERDDPQCQ